MPNVKIWGGVECTCRRVGDAYSDQLTRSGQPHPTSLFKMVQSLARHGQHRHPVLAGAGWWQRPNRFYAAPNTL